MFRMKLKDQLPVAYYLGPFAAGKSAVRFTLQVPRNCVALKRDLCGQITPSNAVNRTTLANVELRHWRS